MVILISLFFLLIVGFIPLFSGYGLLSYLNTLRCESGSKPILYIKKITKSPVLLSLCFWGLHVYVAIFVHDGCMPDPDIIFGLHQSNFVFLFILEFLIFICIGALLMTLQPLRFLDLLRFEKDTRYKTSRGLDLEKWITRLWQLSYIALSGVIVGQYIGSLLRDW